MKKKLRMILLFVLVMCMCQGCGNDIPDMTHEQQEVITQYAAQLLLKYDAEYSTNLRDINKILAAEEKERLEQEAIKDQNDLPPEEDTSLDVEEDDIKDDDFISDGDVVVIEPEEEFKTIQELFGFADISIESAGYTICSSYPETSDAEVFFSVDATEGCKFLVMKFNVTNLALDSKEVDFRTVYTRFRASINGGSLINTIKPILPNEMSSYKGSIASGETIELVLLAEVKEEQLQDISTLDLIVKLTDDSTKITIQ